MIYQIKSNSKWECKQQRNQHLSDAKVAKHMKAFDFMLNHLDFAKAYHKRLMFLNN